MEDSEDESDQDSEDESDKDVEHESEKDMKDGFVEDAVGESDAEDVKGECHENAEDKDVENESHEDAKKEFTDKHIHSNAWVPVNDMGCNESWAATSTNPSYETDNRVAYKTDFGDNVNPWVDYIGKASYFTTDNESIQQSLLEHSNHWDDDGEGDKNGFKR
ncbi:hypothetical protein BDQ17DRAFT_526641 [Cyathus striatus]|nr:hypothetical protein BDQ17DRAFT_526641 [Cyathus striatus]